MWMLRWGLTCERGISVCFVDRVGRHFGVLIGFLKNLLYIKRHRSILGCFLRNE